MGRPERGGGPGDTARGPRRGDRARVFRVPGYCTAELPRRPPGRPSPILFTSGALKDTKFSSIESRGAAIPELNLDLLDLNFTP